MGWGLQTKCWLKLLCDVKNEVAQERFIYKALKSLSQQIHQQAGP